MKFYGKLFLNAILAGVSIGVAGTVFLRVPEPMLGSWLFGFGLLTIVVLGFKLFTGVIGYLGVQGRNMPRYALECAIVWAGNLAGTALTAALVRSSRIYPSFAARVEGMVGEKLADCAGSVFVLSLFCGLLMYIAVDTFKKRDVEAPVRMAVLFLCVVVFILSGFEHCIANMYYFAVSASFANSHAWAWLALMTAGNAVGGMVLPLADLVRK